MDLLSVFKYFDKPNNPFVTAERKELKKLICELNNWILIVQYGTHLNEDCLYLRFNNIGLKNDWEQYLELNLFEKHVCFNSTFPNQRVRDIFKSPFFSERIFNQFNFMTHAFGKGIETPSGSIVIFDTREDFELDFNYYPDKFVTFRDFYVEMVALKEVIESNCKIRFKELQ